MGIVLLLSYLWFARPLIGLNENLADLGVLVHFDQRRLETFTGSHDGYAADLHVVVFGYVVFVDR